MNDELNYSLAHQGEEDFIGNTLGAGFVFAGLIDESQARILERPVPS